MTALNGAFQPIQDWNIRTGEQTAGVWSEIEAALTEQGFLKKDIYGVRLAFEEALTNALKHGNGYDREKSVRIALTQLTVTNVEFLIEDDGKGFDPDGVPDPLAPENLELPHGRGLLIMRSCMSEVEYFPPGNKVRLLKRRQ